MRALYRADYAFCTSNILKRIHRFVISDRHVFCSARIMQIRMLRSYAGIVQTCGYRINGGDLPFVVLTEIRLHAVEYAFSAFGDRSGMKRRIHAFSRRLAAYQPNAVVRYEFIKRAHSIAAASDTRQNSRRELSLCLEYLRSCLFAYHALKITYNHRKWMRTHYGTENIQRIVHSARPFAHSFAYCILERHSAACNCMHLSSQKLHSVHIQRLTLRILLSHEYLALHAEQRRCRSRRDAVLSCSCLCDNSRLAHLFSKKNLPEHVVYLVRACVVEILTLQIYFCTAEILSHIVCIIEQRRSARIVSKQILQLSVELLIMLIKLILTFQLQDFVH